MVMNASFRVGAHEKFELPCTAAPVVHVDAVGAQLGDEFAATLCAYGPDGKLIESIEGKMTGGDRLNFDIEGALNCVKDRRDVKIKFVMRGGVKERGHEFRCKFYVVGY